MSRSSMVQMLHPPHVANSGGRGRTLTYLPAPIFETDLNEILILNENLTFKFSLLNEQITLKCTIMRMKVRILLHGITFQSFGFFLFIAFWKKSLKNLSFELRLILNTGPRSQEVGSWSQVWCDSGFNN